MLTAIVTVHPVAEGADARGEGREGEIVVVKLTIQGHHVGKLSVVNYTCVRCVQDVIGHLSDLKVEEK